MPIRALAASAGYPGSGGADDAHELCWTVGDWRACFCPFRPGINGQRRLGAVLGYRAGFVRASVNGQPLVAATLPHGTLRVGLAVARVRQAATVAQKRFVAGERVAGLCTGLVVNLVLIKPRTCLILMAY